METHYQPADIFLTRGTSFLSKAIRFFTRNTGESRTKVNHVGVLVTHGTVDHVMGVEALSKVQRRPLQKYVPRHKTAVAVFRPTNLSYDEVSAVIDDAESQVGKTYGYIKIVAHLIDWMLGGAYVARRITRSENYPICSWVVAHAFEAAGKNFGVETGEASPDDIWDFVTANPDKYVMVRPLEIFE